MANLDSEIVRREIRSHSVLQSTFNAAALQLDTLQMLANNDTRTIRVRLDIEPQGVVLSGEPLLKIGLKCLARLVAQSIDSPGVFGYGQPDQAPTQREVAVERFAFGDTSIVHKDDRISVDIDLSSVRLPPLSQIRYIRTTSTDELDCETFAITCPQNLRITDGAIGAEIYLIHL
ncbi:MAG TPA: hypothetical protein VGK64_06155 [Bryobacteraceae bacterium]